MDEEKHKERHIELHKALDELVADFIDRTERHLTETTVMELIEWSFKQTQNPTEEKI